MAKLSKGRVFVKLMSREQVNRALAEWCLVKAGLSVNEWCRVRSDMILLHGRLVNARVEVETCG